MRYKFRLEKSMLKFIAFSFIIMTIGCAVADKIEGFVGDKNKYIGDYERYMDTDTLMILKNYGLINSEKIKM
ncbi:hypothetical protein [Clostridium butyricum]|uniref:hypothetical protein n=2 Tax=Clostridium butyricum TaxID=1492 RepID=UPI0022E23777|nr:hypothetical protein [Clostridium butyricum]